MGNWEGVSEFVAVAEQGGFTPAAAQLGISTAQVSRQVTALETRLATKLFYRTTRKVSLTEAGEVYYQHCRQVLDGLEEAERALSQLQSTPRGKLKITAPTTYGETRISPLLNDFMLRYPELEVHCRLTNQKVDLVEAGFDLAIRLGQLEDSSMMARRLATRTLHVCASEEYLAEHGVPETPEDLAVQNCLQGNLGYWRFAEQGVEKNVRVTGPLHCNSGQVLLDAALKGLGVVQLPDYYVQDYLAKGLLTELLVPYRPAEEGIWALYPHNRHLSPKVRVLVDFLSEQLG
ncbi:LysR substrate-binding domain-containing protein [Aliamphritea spongicola]|uniref:LysR substrate-binding domain-containing protein n=1 Tax=Aliamphritea spongicola TaxID=707589 RepID=UPI00196B3C69|nr:LysR substrate-binding domain-containing protein [Aliamphritea spongicola]MBN3563202.1 LysR family transcriptional regulator [Aliamphritea spongicola]